jgi:DNA processing protein
VTAGLPDAAYAAALASIPGLGPRGLRTVLDGVEPETAWDTVAGGHPADPRGAWRRGSGGIDVAEVWARHAAAGVGVHLRGDAGYPSRLDEDPDAPAVLFSLGDVAAVGRRAQVAVVGTRRPTRYGLGVAAGLGADLAVAGVSVVTGLDLGIDGAAHEGACGGWAHAPGPGAPPVAVVPGGLGEPHPRRHERLWERVAACGAIVSEVPVGVRAERWRFPARNRIVAALVDVVVVVECHVHGASLLTARAALDRGTTVGAVPGSVGSPASAGTNALLAHGALVVRDAGDVLVAVGLRRGGDLGGAPGSPPVGTPPDPGRDAVLEALDWAPVSLDQVVRRAGLPLSRVLAALERLAADGLVRGGAGWWERR